jgi:DeoR/GlpR family transcriptional regulator of sugar metabolism
MMDSRKIGRTALSRVMGLNEIDILITNDDADPNIIAAIRSQGVDVRLV